jgi:hypothetical protein
MDADLCRSGSTTEKASEGKIKPARRALRGEREVVDIAREEK